MFWQDIVSAWLSNKTRQDRSILDLIRSLVETNIIPETLVDNSMLQTILQGTIRVQRCVNKRMQYRFKKYLFLL